MVLYEVVGDRQVSGWRGDVIKISDVEDHFKGVAAEYKYIEEKFGKNKRDWRRRSQALIKKEGVYYDRIDLVLSDGSEKSIYFDITSFWGKWSKDWGH